MIERSQTSGQEKTVGLIITRSLNPQVRNLYYSWTQNVNLPLGSRIDLSRPQSVVQSDKVLAELVDEDNFDYIQKELVLARTKIARRLLEERIKRGMLGDNVPAVTVEAFAKCLFAFGVILKRSGVRSFLVDFGTRYRPQVEAVDLQDLDTCLEIALNTVISAIGPGIKAPVLGRRDPGEREDFDAFGSWRQETLDRYR